MNAHKIFHTTGFMLAFVYLVMCPAVHDLSFESIRHDLALTLERELQQRTLKKDFNGTSLKLPDASPSEVLFQLRTVQEHTISIALLSTLPLTLVSTTRLNL